MNLSTNALSINPAHEILRIIDFIREMTYKGFRRKGAVIGLSGGIDSAVVAALCVKALGKDKVLALILPEKESNPISAEYAKKQADTLDIRTITIDITPHLESFGVYEKRDAVVKALFPNFDNDSRFYVTLPQNLLEKDRINYHSITIQNKKGHEQKKRLPLTAWLEISACQNMKQRVRMMHLYYHAERLNCLVAGTTNKTETIQGFFVKYGDGGVDIEPIAHLYKTQVYAIAKKMDIIQEIIDRPPSPDTYSLPVTDKEFYFCLDYALLDWLLYACENSISPIDAAQLLNLKEEQINRAYKDIKAKKQATWHQMQIPPSLS